MTHLETAEYSTVILKYVKRFQTQGWFIILVVSGGGQHKGRLYEDYSDEIVKFIILTAGYSKFFAAEPCRISRVQTPLSTSSESIKSDTSYITIFINPQVHIFVILIIIGKTIRTTFYEDISKGHLMSGKINHTMSLWIYLSIHFKARSMIYTCVEIICG